MASASHLLPLGQPMLPGKSGRRLPDIKERAGRGAWYRGVGAVGVHAQGLASVKHRVEVAAGLARNGAG